MSPITSSTTPLPSPPTPVGRAARRRRRRRFTHLSLAAGALVVGTGQCDAPSSPAAPHVAAAPTAAPATPASTTTILATTTTTISTAVPTTTAPAAIVPGPDGTATAGRCTQYDDLLVRYAPAAGWDVDRMSRLAWRESNCWPEIRSRTSDTGLLQINDITLSFLNDTLGEPVDRTTLTDPVQNVRAAAALCDFWVRNGSSCYQPWGG